MREGCEEKLNDGVLTSVFTLLNIIEVKDTRRSAMECYYQEIYQQLIHLFYSPPMMQKYMIHCFIFLRWMDVENGAMEWESRKTEFLIANEVYKNNVFNSNTLQLQGVIIITIISLINELNSKVLFQI